MNINIKSDMSFNFEQDFQSQPQQIKQHKDHHKTFRILNWVLVGVTIFIFCMLIIIASIFFNLYMTNRVGDYDNPQVYAMYVTAITFIIMDLCFMVIWLALVHICFIKGIKNEQLTKNSKLFKIINFVVLIIFTLLNIVVITLLILLLGGYSDTIDQRIGLVIAIGSVEIVKALIMVGVLVMSIRLIKHNNEMNQ